MRKRKIIKVTDNKTAKAYLKNVLSKWKAFCKSHPQFAKAIDFIINE